MEKISGKSNKKAPKVRKWLRIIHRDVGFLMVGISLIYAVSGILLNHIDGNDPAYKTTEAVLHWDSNLSREEVAFLWDSKNELPHLKNVLKDGDGYFKLMLDGGIGTYSLHTGELQYEHHKKKQVVYWINRLHYNKVNGWTIMADLFAVALIFFAVSGLFMVAGKNGVLRRGKWFLIAGIIIPVLYLIIS
jgi:Uncharacterized protein conserved in bacteria